MKNLLVNIFKTLFFFDLALIVINLIPDLKTENPAKLILWREGMAFAVIWVLTLFFLLFVEKRKLKLYSKKGKFKSVMMGLLLGAVVPTLIAAAMWIFKALKLSGFNKISDIYFYIGAILLNAAAGELLIRGYLFKIYTKHQGFLFATVFSTALFLSMNTEIFKLNKIYIANIILLNILLCCLTDKAKGPINIAARFSYMLVSGFALGGKLFEEAYPIIGKATFSGKQLISGDEFQLEGSIFTLVITSLLILFLLNQKYNLLKYLSKENLKRYGYNTKVFFASFGKGLKKRLRVR